MTNTNHTPEPWEHGNNGLIYGRCGEDDVEAPFVCNVIEDSAMQALGMLSPVEEARRHWNPRSTQAEFLHQHHSN